MEKKKMKKDSYVDEVITQTVPLTLLITYKGLGYSVPSFLLILKSSFGSLFHSTIGGYFTQNILQALNII